MTQDILFSQEGQLGMVCLNRAGALNALTLPMIMALQKQLSSWKEDDAIKAVVIRAVPGAAFCAGGDVRRLYDLGRAGLHEEQMQFFMLEYRLNHFIHHLGKPYVALMDGITMGGGVGISLHGSHPVASERFAFAMPETSIGFFPDIGSSHFLTQCKGALGIYLGLTGSRLGAQDALRAGLVKQIVSSEHMQALLDALLLEDLSEDAHQRVTSCINRYAAAHDTNEPSQIHRQIDSCFSLSTVAQIFDALTEIKDSWAEGLLKTLGHKSPFSLKLTLAQLQKAKGLSLLECLKMDYALVQHFMQGSDFYEGVRALLIDKDKNPKWNPASLDAVEDKKIIAYFEENSAEPLF